MQMMTLLLPAGNGSTQELATGCILHVDATRLDCPTRYLLDAMLALIASEGVGAVLPGRAVACYQIALSLLSRTSF